jgi:hypothetical protein
MHRGNDALIVIVYDGRYAAKAISIPAPKHWWTFLGEIS